MKQAVLFALPGTSLKEAGETLRHIDSRFARRFAGMRSLWAFTSSGVRQKLEQTGMPIPGPSEALATLTNEGVTHVAVKSLHLAPGVEYTELRDLVQGVRSAQGGIKRLVLSKPLLEAPVDFEHMIRSLLTALSVGADATEALLLVAHGSRQKEAQTAYETAAACCRLFDRRVVLGTLMSHPGLEDVMRECKTGGIKKLILAPLMIVAGFSARNELAGQGPDSWVSALDREGIRCAPRVKGLGDHDDIVEIWLDDVERMLIELSASNRQTG